MILSKFDYNTNNTDKQYTLNRNQQNPPKNKNMAKQTHDIQCSVYDFRQQY